jgi:hypothetical protein
MPGLLLIEAAREGTDPLANRRSSWASALHDELEKKRQVTPADRQRVSSWLRVQAVGRDTITVAEPRVGAHAGLWTAAAQAIGLATQLRTEAGQTRQPAPDSAAMGSAIDGTAEATATTIEVDTGWKARARNWLLDRAEAAGRFAVRASER